MSGSEEKARKRRTGNRCNSTVSGLESGVPAGIRTRGLPLRSLIYSQADDALKCHTMHGSPIIQRKASEVNFHR